MNKRIVAIAVSLLAGFCAAAGPARPGPITITQPDGYSFTAFLKGDERGHVLMTADGCGIVMDGDGYYCYAWFDASGERYSSGVHVGQKASSDVLLCSRQIPFKAIRSLAAAKRPEPERGGESVLKRMMGGRSVPLARIGRKTATDDGAEGGSDDGSEGSDDGGSDSGSDDGGGTGAMVKHGLVILAEFSDVPFTYTKSDFEALLTRSGYDVNGATGSAIEYFNAQFNGLYDFQFTVSDIVTVSNERAYYGGNDAGGNDTAPEELIREACELADEQIDFSLFDDDGDGEVDNVFVFFAGGDEAQGAGDDCIWSHAWYLLSGAGISLSLDGVLIDRYACSAELTVAGYTMTGYDYEITGIGTFCHEYSHTFGLPDLYDTDYDTPEQSDVAAGLWMKTALMDGGNYNNDGNTPPYYNAVERDCLGIWEPETLKAGTYVLEPVNVNGRYLKMETGVEGEYFLFECRSNDGWDAYINDGYRAAGLLVYHIDKSSEREIYSDTYDINTSPYLRWTVFNEVNANPEHQCADLVEADARVDRTTSTVISAAELSGVFFPAGRTEFTPETEPSFSSWDGFSSDLSITDISMDEDGNVVFTVIESSDIATPSAVSVQTEVFQDAVIISWNSNYSTTRNAFVQVSGNGFSEEYEITPYSIGEYACVAEGLEPGVNYTAKIWYNDFNGDPGEIKDCSFTTKPLSSNPGYAYIYFTEPANSDGSFTTGSKAPLRVYNATDAVSVDWTLGGSKIQVGQNGYYAMTTAGSLRATITYKDGSVEIITRKITLKAAESE